MKLDAKEAINHAGPEMSHVSATDALKIVKAGQHALIDVRSEGEFKDGSITGFCCLPILTNEERHQVGLTYKKEGQEAAIAAGYSLVASDRQKRTAEWAALTKLAPTQQALVTCWRGGLRSKIACEWLQENNVSSLQAQGGYKAMRQELLKVLRSPPPLVVLAGLTGSGKTALLGSIPGNITIDLEAIAQHRGSSFGSYLNQPQPSQTTFENSIGLKMFGVRHPLVIEDESAVIGKLHLPSALRAALSNAPVIYLETPQEERCRNIFEEYVTQPLSQGTSPELLYSKLATSLRSLTKRLGGSLTQQIEHDLTKAFQESKPDLTAHARWIGALLVHYYDKGYDFSFNRLNRKVIFRGNFQECSQWVLTRYNEI